MTDETNPLEHEVAVVEVPEGTAAIDDSPEAGIEALRQQMSAAEEARKKAEGERDEARRLTESERAAREEAERRADHASTEAHSRAQSALEAQYDSVVNAEAAARGDLAAAKTALRDAMHGGDFDKAADLSADIGVIAARVRSLEQGKQTLERQREQGPQASQQPTANDQKEAFIRSKSPRAAAWLRRNDRYFTDRNFALAVSGAHNLAIAKGIAPDSDEYFRYIEDQAGARPAESAPTPVPAAASVAASTAPRVSPTPAAPPAGSTGATARPSTGGTSVQLSAEERELCRTNGISEANYAKHKIALMSEGRINIGH